MTLAKHLPRFRRARDAQRELAERETWSRKRIESFQLDRLNDLWRHVTISVPYYRQMRAERTLPDRFSSVSEYGALVPVLDKTALVVRHREFLCDHPRAGAWHNTSGSTGTPLRVFRSHADHHQMLCAKYRFYQMWGADIFDRTAWLWSIRDNAKSNFVQRCQDRLRNRLRLSAGMLDDDALSDNLLKIKLFQPVALYGYSRALFMLALLARRTGYHCESLKFVCMTGETATAAMKQTVEEAFNVPGIVEYGSVDCGFLAGESPVDRSLHVRADVAVIETCRRDDAMYDIIVTPLTSRDFPLLRYRIGDVTDRPIQWPGRGMPIMGRIAGRDDDVLFTTDGREIHATSIDEIFEDQSSVLGYRVHQNVRGEVCAQVVVAGATFNAAATSRRLADVMHGQSVSIQIVDRLPQQSSGKHRMVSSDLFNKPFTVQGVENAPFV